MEKKTYSKPMMRTEKFVPNAYCKVCYTVVCQTDSSNSTYNYLYNDSNGNNTFDEEDQLIEVGFKSFSGCNKRQGTASEVMPSYNGFITNYKYGEEPQSYGWGNKTSKKQQNVYWWNASLGSQSDYHVCYDLNTAQIESTNASL